MSGVPGMPLPSWAPELEPCGTLAAYRRHLRRGERIDESCRKASARSWQDRLAAGYERPPRKRPRLVHLAEGDGTALCGKRPKNATGNPAEATCKRCAAILRRHQAKLAPEKFDAVLGRQAAALAARDQSWAERAA